MQKGLVTLEIIIVTMIIAVLFSCALPNVSRILDRVTLDYETKKIYTDMRFIQSHDRMTYMQAPHFNKNIDSSLSISMMPESSEGASYKIVKNKTSEEISTHEFANGINVNKNFFVLFDYMGRPKSINRTSLSDHIKISSKYGETYMIFNSVGRFRCSRTAPDSDDL